jgi:hypothetical protein
MRKDPETALDSRIQRTQDANELVVELYVHGVTFNQRTWGRVDRLDVEHGKDEIEIPAAGWVT